MALKNTIINKHVKDVIKKKGGGKESHRHPVVCRYERNFLHVIMLEKPKCF